MIQYAGCIPLNFVHQHVVLPGVGAGHLILWWRGAYAHARGNAITPEVPMVASDAIMPVVICTNILASETHSRMSGHRVKCSNL